MKQNRVVNLPRSNFFCLLLIACTDQLSDQRSGSMWYVVYKFVCACVRARERTRVKEEVKEEKRQKR